MNKSLWDRFLLFLYWWFSVLIFPIYFFRYIRQDSRTRKLKYSDLGEYIDFMGTPVLCLIADTISFCICFCLLLKVCLAECLPLQALQFDMGYEYILWSCILGQIYTEVIQLRKLGWKNYATHFWNVLDMLIISLMCVAAGIRVYTIHLACGLPDNLLEMNCNRTMTLDNKIFWNLNLDTSDEGLYGRIENYVGVAWMFYGFLGYLQTIKFISLTDSHNVLGPLQLAMKSMIEDLCQILVLLSGFVLSFSICITVTMSQIYRFYRETQGISGQEIPQEFKNLEQTAMTHHWSLFGFIDFIDELRGEREVRQTGVYVVVYFLLGSKYKLRKTVYTL